MINGTAAVLLPATAAAVAIDVETVTVIIPEVKHYNTIIVRRLVSVVSWVSRRLPAIRFRRGGLACEGPEGEAYHYS